MVNGRGHPKYLRSLLVLIALVIPLVSLWGGAPQNVSTQDVGSGFPTWCLLPRTPFSLAVSANNSQPMAELREDPAVGSAQVGVSKPSERGNVSAWAASQPAPAPPSQAVKREGQPPPPGYDGPRTTDPRPPLLTPSAAVWQRVSQAMTALRAELASPSLLPRTPLSPALWTEDIQPGAEQTEDEVSGAAQVVVSKPSETGSGSALAASEPALAQSQAVRPEDQPLAQSFKGTQATDPEPPLMMPSAGVWQRVSQAMTALRAELASPSLLPRTPLSPAPRTEDTEPAAEQTGDEVSGAAQVVVSKPSETGSGSALAASEPALPQSQAVTAEAQTLAQGYNGPQATDPESPLMMPSAGVWQRASQTITILHVEPALPGLLPRSPVSPKPWTYQAQPVVRQAKKGEKGKDEQGETVASQPPRVLIAAGMDPGDQLPAQDQHESLTKDHGETTTASLEVSEHSSAAKTPGGQSGTRGHDGSPILNQGQAAGASQTVPVQPSSAPSSKVQPAAQAYHGPSTTNHATAGALQEPAGEFPSTPRRKWALRDPFKLPPPPRPEQEAKDDPKWPVNRPPGSRGLLVEQLKLKGVVRDSATQKMIAVVTATNNRAYFLREGEAVYDAVVSKITPDAVYFRGNVFNPKREVHFREVVKILSPAPGELK